MIFMDFRGACIDAGEETEHRGKNFIMALTIDLHRPLLAFGEVSVTLLTRSGGHRNIRGFFKLSLFHIDVQRQDSFLTDR